MNTTKLTKFQSIRRMKLLKMLLVYQLKQVKNRRRWALETQQNRQQQGHYDNLVQEMRLHDSERFFEFHRVTVDLFDDLLEKVTPAIEKCMQTREPISAGARLSLTLRYLASGNLMASLSNDYRVSRASVSNIIRDTCDAIWNALNTEAFPRLDKDKWCEVSDEFEAKFNFPNCIGALDGKHCIVQAFTNKGPNYNDYKSANSLVLMALCDANYNFLVVDIGAREQFSDVRLFKNTRFCKGLAGESDLLHLPDEALLPNTQIATPFVVVADKTFPLTKHLMRPFPYRSGANTITHDQHVFNYRLLRARKVVENAFGVLAAKWKIYSRPINAKRPNAVRIIKATVALHNWIKMNVPAYCPEGYVDQEDCDGQLIEGQWRREVADSGALVDMAAMSSNNSTMLARDIRNKFKNYFIEVDPILWQDDPMCTY